MIKIGIIWALFLLTATARGAYRALWIFWPVCLLLLPAVWTDYRVGSFKFSFERVVMMSAVALVFLEGHRLIPGPFHFADFVVLLLIFGHMMSQITNFGFMVLALPQIPLDYLPYLIGRLYLRRTDDIQEVLGAMCRVLVLAAGLAFLESTLRLRLINRLFGGSTGLREVRFGLMRASLGMDVPIALGCVAVLLMPWVFEAARRARDGRGPSWWRWTPLAAWITLFASMSRGPILGAFILLALREYFRRPNLRPMLLTLYLVVGMLAYFELSAIVQGLQSLLNMGSGAQAEQLVMINGQPRIYNGTNHRILLYEVYAEPMRRAGPFGFDIRWLQESASALVGLEWFWSIDNHYIGLRMSRGWVGLLAFDLMLLTTVVRAGRYALDRRRPLAELAGEICASVIALAVILFSVVLFQQPYSLLYFTAGLIASLPDLPTLEPDDDPAWDALEEDAPDDHPEEVAT